MKILVILVIFDHPLSSLFNIGLNKILKIFDYPHMEVVFILILKISYYPLCKMKVGIIFILVPYIIISLLNHIKIFDSMLIHHTFNLHILDYRLFFSIFFTLDIIEIMIFSYAFLIKFLFS